MPLYEYKCTACAHRFERIVKFSDAPLTTCPQCGLNAIEQLISAPAVQFKGSGWYVTDYARKHTTPAASGSVKAESSPDTVSASKDSGNGNGSSSKGSGKSSGNGAGASSSASSSGTQSSVASSAASQ